MARVPITDTVASYAYLVKARGVPVGTLQGFDPSANRELQRIREIKHLAAGLIPDTLEIVPGRTENTINIEKLETYAQNMMEAFGFDTFETPEWQATPFDIVEELRDGNGRLIRVNHYEGCWIQTLGKSIREGTITVTETMTVQVTKVTSSRPRR